MPSNSNNADCELFASAACISRSSPEKAALHESAIASQSILQFGIQTMRYSDEKSTPLPVRMRYATDP